MSGRRIGLAAVAFLVASGCANLPAEDMPGCEIAARYVQAGNAADASRVAGLLAEDVSALFLSSTREKHAVLRGRPAVVEAIENYTRHCADCRSSLRCLHADAAAVYAVEAVTFIDQDGVRRQQSAPLILELQDGRVGRIIYYPASR